MADAASGITSSTTNGTQPNHPRWGVFAGYGLLLALVVLSVSQVIPYFRSLAFGSETAYRYLEASRALHHAGPPQALVYLLPETRSPDLLWLGLLTLLQTALPAAWFPTPQSWELVVWLLQLVCWIFVLILTVGLISRVLGEGWSVVCGALLLASGTLVWGIAHGGDLGLLALLTIGVLRSICFETERQRRFLPGWVLLSCLAGPLGIGLALGAFFAVCFLRRGMFECVSILAVAAGGVAVYLVSLAANDPLAGAGFATSAFEKCSQLAGLLLRGEWNARLDRLWRLAGSLGDPQGMLSWTPGLVALLALAAWIVPIHGDPAAQTPSKRTLGITSICVLPSLLFAAAAGSGPVDTVLPVFWPLFSIVLTASIHTLWIFSQSLGMIPAALWAGVLIGLELLAYPHWLGEARSNSTNQNFVVDALAGELEIEPAEQIILSDVPIARWRFGNDARVFSPAPIIEENGMINADRVVSASTTVLLEPQLSPWKSRRSPLAPWPGPMDLWSNVTIVTQPPILRWTIPTKTGSPKRETPLTDDTAVWVPRDGLASLFCLGLTPHLQPWWAVKSLTETSLPPRSVTVLTTESDGSGRGYGSVLSPEFVIAHEAFAVRLAVCQPDPDCTFRLMVWQNTKTPLTQEVEIAERTHIDLLEPNRTLEPTLFAYDCPEALNPLPDGSYEGWRVVKIVRGTELASGLKEIRWPVAPWMGQRARWKLSDRSNSASMVLDGVWTGPTRAVRGWDFERGDYWGWTVIGEAFGKQPANEAFEGQQNVNGFQSDFFINSYLNGSDFPTGVLLSWPFPIAGDILSFRIGGGDDPERIGMEFMVDGRKIARAAGQRDETLRRVVWDVSAFRDREGTLRILDLSSDAWGHILVDDIQLWSKETAPADILEAVIPIPLVTE